MYVRQAVNLLHDLHKSKDFTEPRSTGRYQDCTQGKYNREGADLLKTVDTHKPVSLYFHSKGLKTDKLPAHVFEIDEDAKDEVSRGA